MARKAAPESKAKLAVVSPELTPITRVAPFKSRFGGDVQKHLLLYQKFVSQWIVVVTSWASNVAHPLQPMSGTHEIYGEVTTSLETYSGRLFSLQFNRAQQEHSVALLRKYSNDPAARIGQEALLREDAFVSAFALIQVVLEAVADCFKFGIVLAGGNNARIRQQFLSSDRFGEFMRGYHEAFEAMSKTAGSAKVTLAPAKSPHENARQRALFKETILQNLGKPVAYAQIQDGLGLAHNLFMSSIGLVCDDTSPPPPPPIDFFRQAPGAVKSLDQTLALTAGFLDSLFSLTQALREINERDLADRLEEISEALG